MHTHTHTLLHKPDGGHPVIGQGGEKEREKEREEREKEREEREKEREEREIGGDCDLRAPDRSAHSTGGHMTEKRREEGKRRVLKRGGI